MFGNRVLDTSLGLSSASQCHFVSQGRVAYPPEKVYSSDQEPVVNSGYWFLIAGHSLEAAADLSGELAANATSGLEFTGLDFDLGAVFQCDLLWSDFEG